MTRIAVYVSAVLAILGAEGHAQVPGTKYSRTTVAAVVKSPKHADGMRVEMRGDATFGFETSVLVGPTACDGGRRPCAIWLNFDDCSVLRGGQDIGRCGPFIDGLYAGQRQEPRELRRLVIKDVVLRGRLSTIRKDLRYANSVPSSVRMGFGHLGAYPAELQVEQMQVPSTP